MVSIKGGKGRAAYNDWAEIWGVQHPIIRAVIWGQGLLYSFEQKWKFISPSGWALSIEEIWNEEPSFYSARCYQGNF